MLLGLYISIIPLAAGMWLVAMVMAVAFPLLLSWDIEPEDLSILMPQPPSESEYEPVRRSPGPTAITDDTAWYFTEFEEMADSRPILHMGGQREPYSGW